ncbi:hypothetical protein GCM10011529_06770 [Polymorphobacter glacialis]|uniref:Uncharacterized protein n=1 Tax=Sandarakinorhabdus glacialis TaxID=1614636 RepID=A0A917E5L7_9SPHN|nr:hypothetical protein [Polymorphobacter glacialis]GGE02969.1 hypothetical protein GCM10011529_06770 [Polymorphobacter glacialis]
MNDRIYRIGFVLLATATLAACGDNGAGPAAPPPAPVVVPPAPQENAFGANFGTAFRASDTATPITPADGDIIPLSLTTEPARIS